MMESLEENVPLIFVLGPRRSGTNFAELLIGENLACHVADLNRNPVKNQSFPRPHLFELFGGKHDIDAENLRAMVEAGGYIVAQSRNPVDWLIARCRYQSLINAETASRLIRKNMRSWLENEYAQFWATIRSKLAELPQGRITTVRYEDAVLDPKTYLANLSDCIGLPLLIETPIIPTQEIRPGGGRGESFVERGDPFKRYLRSDYQEQIFLVQDVLSTDLLEFLNYDGH